MIIAFICCLLTLAQPDAATLTERLDRFDQKTRSIEDLTATFEQQKHSILLRQPLISRGVVRVKGDAVLWETREPVESFIRVDEREARIYYPDENLIEIYALGADLRFLAGSPVPQMATLRERFDVKPADAEGLDPSLVRDALVIALTPRDERLAERIERIRLVLDEASGVMRLFEIVDPQGDATVIIFRRIELNQGLVDEDVDLKTPANARVSRPLGADQDD